MKLTKLPSVHCILILSFLIFAIPYLICSHPLSPDEVDYQYTSTLFSQSGKIVFKSEGDAIFRESGFLPRHFSYNKAGEIVPHGSPGFIIFLGLLKFLLPDFVAILINPLLMVVCIYLIYKISGIIFDEEKKCLYAALLFASMPLVFRGAYGIMPDVLNLAIFLLAFWTVLKLLEEKHIRDYLLLGICLGLLCWVRQTSVLLFIPLGIFILLYRKDLLNTRLVLTGTIAGLFIMGLLLFNWKIFGQIFAVGLTATKHIPSATEHILKEQGLLKTLRILSIRPGIVFNHLRSVPSAFLLAFPPLIFSIFGVYYSHNKEINRKFSIFFLSLATLLVLFFSNFITYGYTQGELTFNSSFLRYLLPCFALLPILAVVGIFGLGIKTRIIFPTVLVFNLIIAIVGPFGLAETILARLYFKEASSFLLKNTNEQSVIFSYYWDKSVFPERIVFTRQLNSREELSALIDKIFSHKYTLYYVCYKRTIRLEKFLMDNYDLEVTRGPELKNPFLKIVPPPRSIYPVKLYKICGSKKDNEEKSN